jgi:hypothetical protein
MPCRSNADNVTGSNGVIITPETAESTIREAKSSLFASPKDRLDFYRSEIHNEIGNLSSRTNAYLSSQSFLVIAYASSMAVNNDEWGETFTLVIPSILALFGVLSAMSAWPGIRAACDIVDHWCSKQHELLNAHADMGRAHDETPLFSNWEWSNAGQRKALLFSKRTPWMFSLLWLFLGGFSIWIQT